MKILVTGGTGFIGRNLVKKLKEEARHEIFCLVRVTSKIDYLKELGIPTTIADITNFDEVDRAFSQIKPDAVFHCAATVMSKKRELLYKANSLGTKNICEACYTHKVKRLIYVSSIAVIDGNKGFQLTDELPYKTTSAYGESKIEAERIVLDYREKGLNSSIIRPCMVYGEGEPHAFGNILKLAKMWLLPVFNLPEMDSKLSLVHVENVVQLLLLALEKEEATKGTFLVADKEVISPRIFFEIIYKELHGQRPPEVPAPLVKFFMLIPPVRKRIKRLFKDRVYDISRAINILGYNPEISTEEGLHRTTKYWKGTIGNQVKKYTF